MTDLWTIVRQSYRNYATYLWEELTVTYTYKPLWQNFFYLLLMVSLLFFALELLAPWRKEQPKFRKDFWLDAFYMFFNFFLFSLLIFSAASDVVVNLFHRGLAAIGINNLLALEVQTWPIWAHLLLGFVVRDFIQWWVHRLLHGVPFLWKFHQVHHSVEEMGFAAHLRYHWMENVVYKSLEYLPLALIGIGLNDFFVIHLFTLIVGHYNHANVHLPPWGKGVGFGLLIGSFVALVAVQASGWGIVFILASSVGLGVVFSPLLRYVFNSPELHIWHHAYDLPPERRRGVNFALTLSCWDYLFGTYYQPHSGRDIRLGYPGVEGMPADFKGQLLHGWHRKEERR